MQCPNCGKSERVTIGAKQYCSHCGKALDTVAQPTTAAVVPNPRPMMRDIAPAPAPAPVQSATVPAPMPMPVVPEPMPPMPTVVAPAPAPTPEPTQAPLTQPNPAGGFHAPVTKPAGPAVLDLSNAAVTPAAAMPDPLIAAVAPLPVSPLAPAAASPSLITRGSDTRDQNAQLVTKSDSISKFGSMSHPAAPMPMPVSVAMAAPAPAPAAAPAPVAPSPGPSLETAISETAKTSTKIAAPMALPNAVVTQVDAMASAKLGKSGAPGTLGTSDAMKLAMAAEVKPQFKPATVAAGLAALVIMGGYIWINNYPKMTIKTAAAKAGIDATIPGYVPSSYSLAGQVAYAPGEITLNFSGANHDDNLQITQRRTNWDSGSLLENYVAKTSSQYSAVEGQGLTVYMYGNGQASWVNHGIWYNIDGNNKLSREQLLKIIYSL